MGNKVVKVATGLLTTVVLGVTGLVGAPAFWGAESTESVDYKMQENAVKYIYTDYCTPKPEDQRYNPKTLDDMIRSLNSTSSYKKMYVKGFDGEVLLVAINREKADKMYSDFAMIYTYKKGVGVRCAGSVLADKPDAYLAKSDGMIFVHNGDSYHRIALMSSGDLAMDMGYVKDSEVNPKPITFTGGGR